MGLRTFIGMMLPSSARKYYYRTRGMTDTIKKVLLHKVNPYALDVITKHDYYIISESKRHCFFGYYDLPPFNYESNKILNIIIDGKSPNAQIKVYDIKTGQNTYIYTTGVWNWQQGCRLRWNPRNGSQILFNDIEKESYCCRIFDVSSKEVVKTLPVPLYDVNKDGSLGLSLNFSRLGKKRPGYGYTNFEYKEENLENEGVDLVNISTGKVERIVRYTTVVQYLRHPKSFSNYYMNHLSFSPSGLYFLFFFLDSSTLRHEAYMFVYDIVKREIIPLEIHDKVSHYVWKNDEEIIATVYDDNMNCHYYCYNIKEGKKYLYNSEKRDGHPSMYCKNCILTDTYPDKSGYQSLFITNNVDDENVIARIYSNPLITGEKRTDLHPRLNQDNSLVCVDINNRGYREIGVFKL